MADTKYTIINTQELKGSTFRNRIIDFGVKDITETAFELIFLSSYDLPKITGTVQRNGNVLYLPFTELQSKSGSWTVELWMTENGSRDKVIQWNLEITDRPGYVEEINPISVTVNYLTETFQVEITQSIVEVKVGWEFLTPDQIDQLRHPAVNAAISANEAAQSANTAASKAQESSLRADQIVEEAEEAVKAAVENSISAKNAAISANSAAISANNAASSVDEAKANAQTAANSAINAANLANEKTVLAETATQNANTATQDADAATISANAAAATANSSASNADNKASLAQTAATAANTAAETANNAKGWQPLLVVDTTTIAGKTLMKLSDWTGGTGTKPTTNVGQWQKADGTYTAVASEAVTLLSNVSEDFVWANKNITDFSLSGYYLATTGIYYNTNANYSSTPKYRVKEGMKFKNPFMENYNVAQAVFFKSDGTFLSSVKALAEIVAPANAYYIAFSKLTVSSESVKVQTDFWALQTVGTLLEDFIWANKNVTDFPLGGYYLNTTGSWGASANYYSTNLLRANAGMQFKIGYSMPGNSTNVVFLRSDKTLISYQNTAGTFTAPSGTYFVGFSKNSANISQPIYVQTDFWALQQDTLLAEYIHTTNLEVAVESVNSATGTFTKTNHGLLNGDVVYPVLNINSINVFLKNVIFSEFHVSGTAKRFVVNTTANTFQLSLTSGGAVEVYGASTNDLTKWHFEKIIGGGQYGIFIIRNFNNNNNYKDFKIILSGPMAASDVHFTINTESASESYINKTTAKTLFFGIPTSSFVRFEYDVRTDQFGRNVKVKGHSIHNQTLTVQSVDEYFFRNQPTDMSYIQFAYLFPFNGTSIKIYKY